MRAKNNASRIKKQKKIIINNAIRKYKLSERTFTKFAFPLSFIKYRIFVIKKKKIY